MECLFLCLVFGSYYDADTILGGKPFIAKNPNLQHSLPAVHRQTAAKVVEVAHKDEKFFL